MLCRQCISDHAPYSTLSSNITNHSSSRKQEVHSSSYLLMFSSASVAVRDAVSSASLSAILASFILASSCAFRVLSSLRPWICSFASALCVRNFWNSRSRSFSFAVYYCQCIKVRIVEDLMRGQLYSVLSPCLCTSAFSLCVSL